MSSLDPPVPLKDHCSIIFDQTLYVYTPSAFLSLPLKQNATWSRHPNGVPVSGGVCLKGQDNGPDSGVALWVVGGKATDNSHPNFSGVQKYSFSSKRWQSITPQVKVTQNRRNHAAAFLNATSSILIYAGSQTEPDTPSLETFTVDTWFPYNVLSFSSTNAPVTSPVLLPWNDSTAVTVGGNDQSRNVYLFDPNTKQGWHDYGTTLSSPLKSPDAQQATLVQGSDGSKVLELYDLSVSPNQVSNYVLQDASGQPASPGQTVGTASNSHSRRDVTLSSWPPYNNSAAPDYNRNRFSLASSPGGLVAMTGGNDQHPVALFNEQRNAWVNTNQFFGLKQNNEQSVLKPTSSSSTLPSSTSTPTSSPTSSDAAIGGGSDHHRTSVILGAVLGSILGAIAILIALLILFRLRQRKKRRAAAAAQEDEIRRMSFADRGAPFMMESQGGEKSDFPHSSVAIVGGGNLVPHHERAPTRGSDSSTAHLVPNKGYPRLPHDDMEMTNMRNGAVPSSIGNRTLPLASDSSRSNSSTLAAPKRTSGWSRYFSGNNQAMPGGAANRSLRGPSERYSGETSSHYGGGSSHDCSTHGPTEIPPLKLGQQFHGGRISKVVTGTPPQSPEASEISRRGTAVSRSLHSTKSRDSRPRTYGSTRSSDGPSSIDENIFTHPTHEDNTNWTPVNRSDWTGPKFREAAPSSVYTHTPANSESLPTGLKPIIEDARSTPEPPAANGARVSDPDTWPRPPSTAAVKQSRKPPPVLENPRETLPLRPPDEDDFMIEEAPNTPTAMTAIPVPASTAMQYEVKKPQKPPTTSDNLDWVRIS